MPFQDTNVTLGIPKTDKFKVGRDNVDNVVGPERGVLLSPATDKQASWVYYECAVGVMLDSGIVVHHRLPQVNNLPDSLSVCDFDDPNMGDIVGQGVNLRCNDQYTDIVQRMGHARYWFRLWGQAIRVNYQVPIPGIKFIGGVPAVPYDKNPQWAFNRIAPGGNYSGVVMWHAAWTMWYTTAVPPTSNVIPASDPAAHVRGDTPLPQGVQAPFSQPDDDAMPSAPPVRSSTFTPFTGG